MAVMLYGQKENGLISYGHANSLTTIRTRGCSTYELVTITEEIIHHNTKMAIVKYIYMYIYIYI